MTFFYLGADHAGFSLKEAVKTTLQAQGIAFEDLSPTFIEGDDYPLMAKSVAKAVANRPESAGITVCGTGIGTAIAANRLPGIRAFVGHSVEEVRIARQHNDANILALGGRMLSPQEANTLVEAFLTTERDPDVRHVRRITQLEQ
ncbi:RpiB/LacA/LacB family sugar-phosphate isomerase [Patescibacteria group bacterium]|nr:RpiB/LacA/LacB family sugar-phosphate isomerase [Patescibacteria group bacterium]